MNTRLRMTIAASALAVAALLAGVANAETTGEAATSPYAKPNESWISISGIVKAVSANAFVLDYGEGTITVEMDDGDRDADAYQLIHGDKVTVNGRIDDDFFQTTTIEASSVYVEKIGTHFWASAVDEEDRFFMPTITPIVVASTFVQGTVTAVRDHEFELDTGTGTLTVNVAGLEHDPLDDAGYPRIRPAARVRDAGPLDETLFEGREMIATSVIKLYRG